MKFNRIRVLKSIVRLLMDLQGYIRLVRWESFKNQQVFRYSSFDGSFDSSSFNLVNRLN